MHGVATLILYTGVVEIKRQTRVGLALLRSFNMEVKVVPMWDLLNQTTNEFNKSSKF